MAARSGVFVGGPQRPLRVVFVSHSGVHGGAQMSMLELIDGLRAGGVECLVVVPEKGVVTSALEERGMRYLLYPYHRWTSEVRRAWWDRFFRNPLLHLARGLRLAWLLRGWRGDVVVTNTITVCEGAIAARMLRVPHITHAREYGDLDHGLHFELGPRLSVRVLSALSARVVFNSSALAEYYRREVAPTRVRRIYNAVSVGGEARPESDDCEWSPEGARPFRCVLVGTLEPGKGHEEAIRAIAALVQRGVAVRLRIVGGSGTPTYTRYLEGLVGSLGLAGHVEMVGHVAEAWTFFQEADVALVCSRMEAFGRVTVEAMKLGTPVIGARSGGTQEVIREEFNGLLYQPGDVADLARKIEALAREPERARAMGERARRFATETFNVEHHAREFCDLLQEVVSEHHGGLERFE